MDRHSGKTLIGEALLVVAIMPAAHARAIARVHTAAGDVEGTVSADAKVRIFKGIPYAAPPVGALRWKPPIRDGRAS